MIRQAVTAIRTHFRAEVPILVRMDSGFFDEAIFVACEELNIGYVCGEKLYQPIRDRAQELPEEDWKIFDRKPRQWRFFEFEDQRGTWSQAGKIVRHAGKIALKVTQVLWDQLRLPLLWQNAHTPPQKEKHEALARSPFTR